MQANGVPPGDEPDLRHWEKVTTAYRTADGLAADVVAGSNARTNSARSRTYARLRPSEAQRLSVDLYIDPICPYTWLATCWLRLVEQHRRIDVTYHPMSLNILNEHRTGHEKYRDYLAQSTGPSQVGTAVWLHHGPDAFKDWHTAFGSIIFDHWRHPKAEEYRTAAARALVERGLPEELIRAADTDDYDEPLRRSHLEGTLPVGVDGGTPVIHFAGMAYFGPVLNAIPAIEEALDLFDGLVLVAGCRDFFELKRSRTSPPVFAPVTAASRGSAPEGAERE